VLTTHPNRKPRLQEELYVFSSSGPSSPVLAWPLPLATVPPPPPMPPHILVDFVVLPPGHDRNVTNFWGWDAHEPQLRCPDYVFGDVGGCSARRALKPKFYQPTQTMVTAGILPFRENSHGRARNRTRDLMISSQRLWPLDHDAGPFSERFGFKNATLCSWSVFLCLVWIPEQRTSTHCAPLNDWALCRWWNVFTVRYGLNL